MSSAFSAVVVIGRVGRWSVREARPVRTAASSDHLSICRHAVLKIDPPRRRSRQARRRLDGRLLSNFILLGSRLRFIRKVLADTVGARAPCTACTVRSPPTATSQKGSPRRPVRGPTTRRPARWLPCVCRFSCGSGPYVRERPDPSANCSLSRRPVRRIHDWRPPPDHGALWHHLAAWLYIRPLCHLQKCCRLLDHGA